MFGLIPFRTNKNEEKGVAFNDFFTDFFNDDFFSPMNISDEGMKKFNADVRETDKEYLVSAELPGVKKEDIALDYKDNNLVIRAKREEVHDESKDNYIRKERSYGEFSRQFYFDNVDKEKICAKFQNGELQIILPKTEQKVDDSTKIFIR
ncbi:Hsp20/alpha crystallin family protein [Clostridium sp. BJN0001]|uniref:Hsp20/alpha crystallin family protein n=1 Tax=Clostridium sp. BJN0001 TaxID=2930219 RepID=UPI001FD526D8|nr:Hsp20/alpha crystallin family protein [Clostridium sp. BJN0001]